jgi:polyhydroxyalkanoate synthesis regulator phasin
VTTTRKHHPRAKRPRTAHAHPRARRAPKARLAGAGSAAIGKGRDLWLAGLGLAGTVYEVATDTFDSLVSRGRKQEPKTLAAARGALRQARARATNVAGDATALSKKKLNEALDALGVENRPRQKNLFHRLGDLTEALL